MEYNFYNLNSAEFENLVQSLTQKLLGQNALVFGEGPDGGRELTYDGIAPFPNNMNRWEGYWVVQAKFKSRDFIKNDNYLWVANNLRKEIDRFINKGRRLPDNYIFVTNATLSAVTEIGGRDKIEKLKSEYINVIPNIAIIAYDEFCKMLDNNRDVRLAYKHFITSGDVLDEILSVINMSKGDVILEGNEIREKKNKDYNYQTYNFNSSLISIDFGTSFSISAILTSNEKVVYIPSDKGKIVVPSVISFFKGGKYIIGKPEYQYLHTKEISTITNVKRYLGTDKKYDIFGLTYTPEDIACLILQSLRRNVIEFIGVENFKVLIAKPTNFNLARTNALIKAFINSGFKIRRITNESSTATLVIDKKHLSEGLMEKEFISILSIDLGGGTFDVSVVDASLNNNDSWYDVLASYGDNNLGGSDFDQAIYEYVIEKIENEKIRLEDYHKSLLISECENVKKSLKHNKSAKIVIRNIETSQGNLDDWVIKISKKRFIRISQKLMDRIKLIIDHVLNKAELNYDIPNGLSHIDLVILAGQGAKVFTVEKYIKKRFSNSDIITDFSENAVILGSSLYSGVLSDLYKSKLILDQTHFEIAIKCKSKEISSNHRISIEENLIVATNPEDNEMFQTILPKTYSSPTKIIYEVDIENTSKKDHLKLEVYEYDQSEKRKKYYFLTNFKFDINIDSTQILLVVDVDANSTIVLSTYTIKNEKFISSIRLNNNFSA